MASRRIPAVIDGYLIPAPGGDQHDPIAIGSARWFRWLDDPAHTSFSLQTPQGAVTIRCEQKRHTWYWYAYHTTHGKLRKAYLGKSAELTATHLESVAARLLQAPNEPSDPPLHVHLLGSPTIERGGRTLPPLPAKATALLAYLAAHERPVARAHVLALLWPESNEQAAQKNLRNTLWHLRRELGHEVVVGGEYLQLGTSPWIDIRTDTDGNADDVEAKLDMDATLRGEFLEGMVLDDAPDFELWLATMREHYHEVYQRNLLALAARYRADKRWGDVITVARRALARDALQEPLYRLLMEAYAMQGDRAAALRQYDMLRDTLERELGVVPLPESDALRDDIIRGVLQPASSITVVRSAHAVAPATPAQPFVGRATELAALESAWALARSGIAQVVLLSGEAGIGKSRLWQAWSSQLEIHLTVLGARCLAPTQQLPFAPLVDLLRAPAIRERLVRAAKATPPPNWLTHIARLMPELHDLRPGLPSMLVPAEDEQRNIFEALVQSLGIAPDQPVVLFVDDLHWADRATLDWLGYLVHRAERTPLLLVGTYRSDEASPALLRLETTWKREGNLHDVPLARLSRTEAETIVAAMEGDGERTDALYEQSAGNPFFLLELLRADSGIVPSTLTDLIERRLERLSATTRQVLHAAAVLQEEIVFDVLQQTSGRTDEETLDALDALLAAQLLAEQDRQFVFSHPLIAFVADAGLNGARRAVLHRRAAAALVRAHTDHSVIAGRLTRHYVEAQEHERAAQYAERAGDQALAVAAPLEAAQFYQQALDLAWTPRRAHGLGRARDRHGDAMESRPAYEAAIQGYERDGEHAMAARAAIEMALTYFADNQLVEVVRWAQQGRDYLGDADDTSTRALMLYLLGAEKRNANDSLDDAAASLAESSRLLAEHDEMRLLPSVLLELGNTRAEQGDLLGAVESFRELVLRAKQTGGDFNQVLGYNNLAYHLLLLGDHAAAREAVEAGIAVAQERDVPLAFQWLWSTSGEIALIEERLDAATVAFERAIIVAERYGNDEHIASCRVSLAIVESRRGNVVAARRKLEEVQAVAARLAVPYLDFHIAYWLAVFTSSAERAEKPDDVLGRAAHALRPGEVARLRRWLELVGGAEAQTTPTNPSARAR